MKKILSVAVLAALFAAVGCEKAASTPAKPAGSGTGTAAGTGTGTK